MVAPPKKGSDEQKPLCYQTKAIKACGDDAYIFHCVARWAETLKINRNMVVLRTDSDSLTLINPLLLSPAGEKALLKLGTINNIVRLGHTMNFYDGAAVEDRYYLSKFKCKRWAPGKLTSCPNLPVHKLIKKGGDTPHPDCHFFVFKSTVEREAVVMLSRDKGGNVLITGDCLQHQVDNPYINVPTQVKFRMAGFLDAKVVISKKWLTNMSGTGPEQLEKVHKSFETMMQAQFQRFISTSGNGMLTKATREEIAVAIQRSFPENTTS